MKVLCEYNFATGDVGTVYPIGAQPEPLTGFMLLPLDRDLIEYDKNGIASFVGDLADLKAASRDLIISEIDALGDALTASFTATEQKGWPNALPEAVAYLASNNAADAPALAIGAAVRGITVKARAEAIVAAAEITAVLPEIASGMRSRVEALVDGAANEAAVGVHLATLSQKTRVILGAAASGNKAAMLSAATNWETNSRTPSR